MSVAIDEGDYFRVPTDRRSLNYSTRDGLPELQTEYRSSFNSNNTERLNVDNMKKLLRRLDCFKE